MEVVSSHLELYWRSYDRFTRGISTLTRVGPTRVPLPGHEKRKLDEELTRVATMASTLIAFLPWPKINIFKGHFRLFYGNH
ncbi:hypothetical protein F2Q70_00022695 [Brassica cretica]|uniref:Uncharacterized protein n=1 Tax=Brassica cretica TaxID=69181 RepID=A0A8S9GUJ7_BRACR|nr:hypothetical protein F2Q70_00022695 [Brassica cretica]